MMASLRLLALLSLLAFPQEPDSFEGRVVSESGQPLQGVHVVRARKGGPEIEVGILVNSDETGTFRLNERPEVLFGQKEDYIPFLYRVDGIAQSPLIVMKRVDPDSIVRLPKCGDPGPGKHLIRVSILRGMMVDNKAVIKQTNGVDTSFIEIAYPGKRRQRMTISSGMISFVNYPEIDSLARTSSIVSRFIEDPSGRDVSGATLDGKHWRWSFIGGGHLQYYDASPSAAEFFDRQIDGLCRLGETTPKMLPKPAGAQDSPQELYPNEPENLKFYDQYLAPLRPYISSKAAVVLTLGSDQGKELPDWRVFVYWVGEYRDNTVNGQPWKQNITGRLSSLEMVPRKRVSMRHVKFPLAFTHADGYVSEINIGCDVYKDDSGLEYWIYSENSKVGKKGDLMRIVYGPSVRLQHEIQGPD